MARYEPENWVAYYQRHLSTLLRVSVGLVQAAFGLLLPKALYGAYLVARAEMAAAPRDKDIPLAESYMRRFYALVRGTPRESFDIEQAARLEVNRRVVHRRLSGQTANGELVDALTDLYATVYGVEPERVRAAASHRAQAMTYSERWVREGRVEPSPLLGQVEDELVRSYTARDSSESG